MKKTIALVILGSLLAAAACSKRNSTTHDANAGAPETTAAPSASDPAGPPPDSLPPAAIAAAIKTQAAAFATLTPNEKKWGVSPTRNDKVTYADGVIIMEHGADAIRGMASNGMSWTIDANAPHANEIKVDRILFATGRVVGRVLAVERKGPNLSVTLGPVEITEVITEANLVSDQQLDPSLMLTYTAPDYPGATSRDEPDSSASASLAPVEVPVMFASYQPPFQGLPVVGPGAQMVLDGYMVAPVALPNLGMTLVHDGPSVKMMATAALDLHSSVGALRAGHSWRDDLHRTRGDARSRGVQGAFLRRHGRVSSAISTRTFSSRSTMRFRSWGWAFRCRSRFAKP